MTFVVNAIKQETQDENKPQNIKFLLDIDSPLFARKLIEKTGLVLLSLSDYNSQISSYGPSFLDIVFENKPIRIVLSKEFALRDFCLFFLHLGFDISDANTFVNPLSADQVKNMLFSLKKDYQNALHLQQQENQQQQVRNVYYQDQGLEKAKKVIERSLEKVNSLLTERGAFVAAKDLRIIKDKVEELKKLRMGTNYEKIRDMLQELFSMVDRIEEEYFSSLDESSPQLFPGTLVTQVDLERQVSALEKVQQQQMFGGTIPVNRKDYVAFGEVLVYLFFFKKDIVNFFKHIWLYVYKVFDYLQVGLLMFLIFLGMSFIYFALMATGELSASFYTTFFSVGFLGVLTYLFSLIRTKNPLTSFFFFVLLMVSYFITLPLLKHTFALS